ncbi:MAG TPA: M48 family metallopeptidase [Noviherbaspirillum sp.]
MPQATAFHGRLFGPGMAGSGTAASGCWDGNHLRLQAGDRSLSVPANALGLEAAGFNLQQQRLSWRSDEGEFALFIEDGRERECFLAQAPAGLAGHIAGAQRQQRRVGAGFRVALLAYGLILALPFLLLGVFLLNTDRLSGWVADKVPLHYEQKIGNLVLAQTRAQARLIEDGPAHDAVKAIGTRLTTGSRYSYRWFVADSKEVNAFAAPGGVIVVHAGLIHKTARAEELAGVLAHEVAHVEQRHSLRSLIKNAGFGVALSLALGDWSGTALSGWIAKLSELKFSRDTEMEADREGLRLLVQAGMDPEPMAAFFGKLADEESKAAAALSLLATHPASEQRMAALREQLSSLPARQYQPLAFDWQQVKSSLAVKDAAR